MTLTFQNQTVETSATSLTAFLRERGLDPESTVVEHNGVALPPGTSATLCEGDILTAFRIVAGG